MKAGLPLFFLFCFFIETSLFSQCPADAGASANPPLVCGPSGTTTLIGTASGSNILNSFWSPVTGLSNPLSPTTQAQVNFPITYTYTVRAQTTNDLVINGDFEAGNGGFASTFIYQTPGPGLITGGTYTVTTSPSVISGNFPPCTDHTTGSGNMLIANATGTPNRSVWCQTFNVNPNSDYVFSMWVGTAASFVPATLQVLVNGQQIGSNYSASSSTCIWGQFSAQWTNQGSSVAVVCIQNLNGAAIGPFFALDDISFIEICRDTAQVHLDLINLTALAVPPPPLSCTNPVVELDGSLSSTGPDIAYAWTTSNGNIVSGAQTNRPRVDQPGQYVLTVTYDDGTTVCTKQTTVTVVGDPNRPKALVGMPDTLGCNLISLELDGSASSSGPFFSYQWSTINGNFVSGQNSQTPTVNQPGSYQLLVRNNILDCADSVTVTVLSDTISPNVQLTKSNDLTCINQQARLFDRISRLPSQFSFHWFGPPNRQLTDSSGASITIDTAGLYSLIVTNLQNGCADTANITVSENILPPNIQTSRSNHLSCLSPVAVLQIDSTQLDSNVLVAWQDLGGVQLADTVFSIQVDSAGFIVVVAVDTLTGCQSSDTLEVRSNFSTPEPEIAGDPFYPCNLDTAFLRNQMADPHQVFGWSTPNGTMLTSISNAVIGIGGPGLYILQALDTLSGCLARDSFEVMADANLPSISILPPDTINCSNREVLLQAQNPDMSGNTSFFWQTTGGNFLQGTNTLTPLVNEAGVYEIVVENNLNGCRNRASVLVVENLEIPNITSNTPVGFTCRDTIQQLTVLPDSSAFEFSWSTRSGNIVSGSMLHQITVNAPGIYLVEIKDRSNDCIFQDSFFIRADNQAPVISISSPDTLNCLINQASLDATTSPNFPNLEFLWFSSSGNSVTDPEQPIALVNAPEIYYLQVTDTTTGCVGVDSVLLMGDFTRPVFNFDTPLGTEITCANPEIVLEVPILDNLQFFWQNALDSSGMLATGSSGLVSQQGWVYLSVQNTNNGCVFSDSLFVGENRQIPVAEAGLPQVFDCSTDSVFLHGLGSSIGSQFEYLWSTDQGAIAGSADLISATVLTPGLYFLEVTDLTNGCRSRDSVEILADRNLPLVQIRMPDTINCRNSAVVLDASGSSQGSGIMYSWQTSDGIILSGSTSLQAQVGAPGTYSLTIFDSANQCENSLAVQVSQDTLAPQVLIDSIGILTCESTQVLIQSGLAPNNYSFSWSTSNGLILSDTDAPSVLVGQAGSYDLVIVDLDNGCTAVETIRVAEDLVAPSINISQPPPLTCRDTVRQLFAGLQGLPGNYAITWSSTNGHFVLPPNGPLAVVDSAGSYQVVVRDLSNGCKDSVEIEVLADRDLPDARISSNDTVSCLQQQIILEGIGSAAGPAITYQWTGSPGMVISGGNTLTALIQGPGNYVLQVTNQDNGCQGIASFSPPLDTLAPVFDFVAPVPLNCNVLETNIVASHQGNPGGIEWIWSGPAGGIVMGGNSPNVLVNLPGTYLLTARNPLNGCETRDSIELVADTNPPVVTIQPPAELDCTTTSVLLDASGSSSGSQFSYRWSTRDGHFLSGENTLVPRVDSAGTYVLTIVNIFNGCEAVDSVTVRTSGSILSDFSFELIAPDCEFPFGTIFFSQTVGGQAPFSYSVDGGFSFWPDPVFDSLPSGIYNLHIRDQNGCELTSRVTIVDPLPPILSAVTDIRLDIGASYQVLVQTTTDTNAFVSINWTPIEGLSCSNCLNPVIQALENRDYQLTVVDTNGCVAFLDFRLVVRPDLRVYIPSAFSPNGDGINDFFYPFASEGQVRTINRFLIFDRWGNLIFENKNFLPNVDTDGWNGRYKEKLLDPAVFVYYLEIEFVNGTIQQFSGDVTLSK